MEVAATVVVGTVEVALDTPAGTWARRLNLRSTWGRARIRQATVHYALAMVLWVVEGRAAQDPKLEGPFQEEGGSDGEV